MEKNEGGGWGRRGREDNQTTISSDFFKGERREGGMKHRALPRKVVARLMETPQSKSPFRGAVFPCLKIPATCSLGWEQFLENRA